MANRLEKWIGSEAVEGILGHARPQAIPDASLHQRLGFDTVTVGKIDTGAIDQLPEDNAERKDIGPLIKGRAVCSQRKPNQEFLGPANARF